MATALSPKDKKLAAVSAISGIVTNLVLTEDVGLSHEGALNLRIDLEVTGVTVVGSIVAKLQMRSPGGSFTDLSGANASVTISGNGTSSIRQNIEVSADQPNMPLQKMTRVVLTTTNAGDAITVNKVYYQQGL